MERYESLGPLGEGSYGTVVKCRHRDSGRLVAIKKFLDSDDDRMVKKIALREIKLLRQLRHENLVSLLEAWRRRRRWYLVFEFVERTLLDHLEQNPGGLDLDTSRRYLFQILRACAFCHQHNIMHRDIKPENILISMGGVVKLCDFGFARTVASPAAAYTDYVATRWYRAPELLVGDTKYGKPVDVWAIGCLLIETLTGQPLFPGDSDLDQIHHIVRCFGNLTLHHQELFRQNPVFSGVRPPECSTPVSLQQRFHMMSPSALDLAQNCLEVNPEKRAQCWELLDHLLFTQDAFHIRFVGELNATIQNDHRENSTLPKINKILRPECNKGDERKRRAKEKQPEDFNVKVNKDKTKRKNNPKPSRPPGNAVEHLTKQSKSIRNTIPGKCHGASKNKLGKGTGTENSRSYKPPTCNSLDLSEKTNERMDHWCKVRKDGESIVCRPAEERLMENSRSSNLEQNLEFGRRRSNTTASRVSGRCRCLSSPLESNSRPTKESTQVSNICPVEETKRTSEHQTRVDWRDPNSLEAIPSNPKLSTTPKPNQSSSSSPMAPQVHFSAQSCTVLTDPKMPPQRSNLIPKTLTKVKKVTQNIGDNQACRSLTSTIGAENCPKRSVLGKDQKEDLKWKVPTQITSLCMPCENTAEGTGLLKTRNVSDKENHVDPASAVSRRTQSKRSVHGVFSGTWRDEKHVSHGHLELVVKSLNPVSLQSMVMTKTSRAALANTMTDDVKDLTSIVSAQGQDSSPQDTVHNSLSGADLMEGLRSSIPHVSSPTPLLSPAIACSSEVGGHLTLVTVFHSGTPEIRSVHQNAGHRSANPAQQNQDFLSGHVSGLLPYQRERVPDPSDFRVGGSSVTAARKVDDVGERSSWSRGAFRRGEGVDSP